jgi:putative Holliday junction resolvase
LLNNPHTKYIGIDYGKKRTGISISDYDKIISFPLETVETKNLINFLKDLTKKEKIEKIIIGKPLKLNNKIHALENEIVDFIESINRVFPNISIHRVDERFTSKISNKILNQLETKKKIRMDKSIIDKISASLILESYLIKTAK